MVALLAGSDNRSGGGWDGWVQLADSGVGCTASVGCGALSLWLLWLEVVWEGGTVYRNGACFCGCLSGLEHLLADSGQDARRVRLRLGCRECVMPKREYPVRGTSSEDKLRVCGGINGKIKSTTDPVRMASGIRNRGPY